MEYSTPIAISIDLLNSRDNIVAKPKLNLILRKNATVDAVINPGDLVQVYVKHGQGKRGRWLSPRVVQKIDRSSGNVTTAGVNGRNILSAFEDTRITIVDDDFSTSIIESIDSLDDAISEALESDIS